MILFTAHLKSNFFKTSLNNIQYEAKFEDYL